MCSPCEESRLVGTTKQSGLTRIMLRKTDCFLRLRSGQGARNDKIERTQKLLDTLSQTYLIFSMPANDGDKTFNQFEL